MPFPDRGRVVYGRNPLKEVICQLRFPPVLKIDSSVPAGFQDRIRGQYPMYVEVEPGLPLPAEVPKEVLQMLRAQLSAGPITRQFTSADERWKVTLNREFLALATTSYTRWEEFANHLSGPLSALIEEFAPAFATRIGLRYRNQIQRSKFGLNDVEWHKLLAPHIAGELGVDAVRDHVQQLAHRVLVRLQRTPGQVWLRHGLVKAESDDELVYAIDSDFFSEQRAEMKDVNATLAEFNRSARCLFRWCISDLLHERMEPETLGEA